MEKITRTILIDAPADAIFEYTTNPTYLLDVWPSMIEVKNVALKGDGGHAFDFTYKMAAMHFHGHSETIEVVRNARRVSKNEGGIPSTFIWTFTPRGQKTEIGLEVEYELPLALLGRLAAPFLKRLNEREADTMLTNLKDHLETSRQTVQAVQAVTRNTPEIRH